MAAVLVVCFLLLSPLAAFDNFLSAAEPQAEEMLFHPMNIAQLAGAGGVGGYNVNQIRTAYGLPFSGGAGVTIAIIIAYDTPTIWTDLTQFSIQNNLPLPNDQNFEVHKMSNTITVDSGWSQEACLDVEWAHAIAPDAKILLVESVNAYSPNMFAAVQYATSRPDVSVVSMSWGSNETRGETANDVYFSDPDVAFFAASGDDGSVVMYPSCSPYVVAVGGTTLNLDSYGNVISETAWSGSGGGVSQYENIPTYQSSYGLTSTKRCVPDVAYNADKNTGVQVYCNGHWWIVGGTSAGAPQWAAIHALGASAKLSNLYDKAKTSSATYFRDITSGATSKYTAKAGYDYVTGLGSPLTSSFVNFLTASPSLGGPATNITLTMSGLTGPTASISYLNPISQNWVPLVNNIPVTQGNTTVNVSAPDLMQANPSGDNTQTYDSIILRAVDANGKSYNTTVPFNLNRRGLTQVGTAVASGVFGTSTDLTGRVYVRSGDTLPLSGVWFNPGNATLLWDNTYVGNAVIDQTGAFSTSVTVPTSTAGQHTLTVQDATTAFTVNVAYLPTLTTDYTNPEMWHISDFVINLSSDSPVNETFYRINGGDVQNVTANGQPVINMEGASNTLEYWCIWSPNANGLMETAHASIIGIKLDKTPPTGLISTNSLSESETITLNLNAADATSGVTSMRFSNDNSNWSSWEPYTNSKTWSLDGGDGVKTVYAQFQNAALLVSTYNCTVTLMTPTPTPTATPNPTPTPTATPTPNPTIQPTEEPSVVPTNNPSPSAVPEIAWIIAVSALGIASLFLLLMVKKRAKDHA
jgi:hypothetical protein